MVIGYISSILKLVVRTCSNWKLEIDIEFKGFRFQEMFFFCLLLGEWCEKEKRAASSLDVMGKKKRTRTQKKINEKMKNWDKRKI